MPKNAVLNTKFYLTIFLLFINKSSNLSYFSEKIKKVL